MTGGKEVPHNIYFRLCDARNQEALFELAWCTIWEDDNFLKLVDSRNEMLQNGFYLFYY